MKRDITDLRQRLERGERAALAQAITLVESRRPDHQVQAQQLVQAVLPHTGKAVRVGISGVPGAGKSTTIDALGVFLTAQGHRVAVLAVDPTSSRSGGSILGDKTRMNRLALDEKAFIRPSPTAGTLGGVAAKTRESLLLCEAAGYDIVLVETVGVGQSEVAVANMVDCFVVLMAPGTGDELQGIKRGILELADIIAVNKADGDMIPHAQRAASEYRMALHILPPASPHWQVPVLTLSGLLGAGLDALWQQVLAHQNAAKTSGTFESKRTQQQVQWMWSLFEERLLTHYKTAPALAAKLDTLEAQVRTNQLSPSAAVAEMLATLGLD